jgi:hypothetical protein
MVKAMRPPVITTRTMASVALGLTALLFAVSIRDELRPSSTEPAWLLGVPHGWLGITVNVAFYGYLCWIAFCFISASKGRERLFVIGWSGFILWPVKILRPDWVSAVADVEFIGIIVSLFAALSLLLHPGAVGSDGANAPSQETPS